MVEIFGAKLIFYVRFYPPGIEPSPLTHTWLHFVIEVEKNNLLDVYFYHSVYGFEINS